ncbi:MAG: SH3 domain-containing protein [Leptonema illini]|jgi:hypothetical protein|uniref:SH3 domain-containing protein n=1 Tax=Leptonema illini TaxID=183 RepID=A0A833GWM8_9LEPT|nr:MAG: SH3 domain-containing protein [Leptonema illini]
MKSYVVSILLTAGLLVMPFAPAVPQESDTQEAHPIGVVVTKLGLSFRDGPSISAKALGWLPLGAQVRILGRTRVVKVSGTWGSWLQVRHQGQSGWVFKADAPHHDVEEVHLVQSTEALFVSPEEGLDIRSGPSSTAPILAHLAQGSLVRCLTTAFFADERSWVYGTSQGRTGYLLFGNTLTPVLYNREQLENGPFEGMVVGGLPEPYKYECPNPCPAQLPQDEAYTLGFLIFNGGRYTYLEYQGRVKQIIFRPSDRFPSNSMILFGTKYTTYGYRCTDPSGIAFPIALVDFPFNESKRLPGKELNSWSYRDSIMKVWLFDAKAGRLVPARPPSGSLCHYVDHRH